MRLTMIPSHRLRELRRRQVDRLQRRVEQLERDNDKMRSDCRFINDLVDRLGELQALLHELRQLSANK